MSQKRSEFDTLPMCRTHHEFQHHVGWSSFTRKYGLNIYRLLELLQAKPKLRLKRKTDLIIIRNPAWWDLPFWMCEIYGEVWMVGPTMLPPKEIEERIYALKREALLETFFRPLAEKRRVS